MRNMMSKRRGQSQVGLSEEERMPCKRRAYVKAYTDNRKTIDRKKRNEWRKSNPEYRGGNRLGYLNSKPGWISYKLNSLRRRAKLTGKDFTLTKEDMLELMTPTCPVLGIELNYGILNAKTKTAWDSPSVDRIDNDKGYIKSNVVIVSNYVNRVKYSLSLEEIQTVLPKMVEFYKRFI